MPSSKKTTGGSSSLGDTGAQVSRALVFRPSSRRSPLVEVSKFSSTSAIISFELIKTLIEKNETDMGKFLRLTAASRNSVNAADAALLVAAAILESTGNKSGASKILARSRTLNAQFNVFQLMDESVRDSFVILLFAIMPDLVKSVEVAMRTVIDRLTPITTVDHSITSQQEAFDKLVEGESVSIQERSTMMSAAGLPLSPMTISDSTGLLNSVFSIVDSVKPSDSASVVGADAKGKIRKPVGEALIHNYLKHTKKGQRSLERFASEADSMIDKSRASGDKSGIGYKKRADSIIEGDETSVLSTLMNSLTKSHKSYRSIATSPVESRQVNYPVYTDGAKIVDVNVNKTENSSDDSSFGNNNAKHVFDYLNQVTIDDIREEMLTKPTGFKNLSIVDTAGVDLTVTEAPMSDEDFLNFI